MKAVDQRYFEGPFTPYGDCVSACIASMFDLELGEVPQFVERSRLYGTDWQQEINMWASEFGIAFHRIMYSDNFEKREPSWHPGYWIGCVVSRDPGVMEMNRKKFTKSSHAVVMWGTEVKHDPNPVSREYAEPYRFIGEAWFELYNPAVFVRNLDWRVIREVGLLDADKAAR